MKNRLNNHTNNVFTLFDAWGMLEGLTQYERERVLYELKSLQTEAIDIFKEEIWKL